jgi:hypothetical protein
MGVPPMSITGVPPVETGPKPSLAGCQTLVSEACLIPWARHAYEA